MPTNALFMTLVLAFSGAASAQTAPDSGESKLKISNVMSNKKFQADDTLTDAKMKADDGSLSRYSLRTNLSYYGPTLTDLEAKDQPNPDGSVGSYATALGGSLGFRIRLSPTRTISMGTGLKALYPMHGIERFDMNDPYVSYDMASRFWGIQMRNSPGFSIVTIPNYTKIGEYATLDFKNSLIYDLGRSGFAVGFDTSFGYFLYNRGYERRDGKAARNNLSLSPNIKYNFTDKFNMNTSVNMSFWNPRTAQSPWIMWNRTVTQSVGFGYAIKRDIYVSPYFRMFPSRLAADTTTFNLSAILSIL
ncbi:MAG: hypothetical protein ACK5P7_12060 [Bdellovibrio sp.]